MYGREIEDVGISWGGVVVNYGASDVMSLTMNISGSLGRQLDTVQ